ncbi:hypothetical protein H6P81_020552 [Aristolochia fimbriata]|uniref:Uncharacterized protein n=1 Tax=Aristolochia fimbriata TaxID=158543 RepID=A0AAV7DXZ7_ARIFI|nr:hypothetical protein H6P81_020552 [Aristolochia fimbriata]
MLSGRSFQQKSVRSRLKSRLEPYRRCNVVIVGLEELFRFHVEIPLQPAKPPHLDGCRRAECWSDWIGLCSVDA